MLFCRDGDISVIWNGLAAAPFFFLGHEGLAPLHVLLQHLIAGTWQLFCYLGPFFVRERHGNRNMPFGLSQKPGV